MEGRHPEQAEEHKDTRGSEPPTEGDPEDHPRPRGDRRSPDDQGGPLGNPEVDEEALGHRQQQSGD